MMKPAKRVFMVRIPWDGCDKSHIVGEIEESDRATEPSRAFWTNEPEFISRCGKVRGDWRSIQVFTIPPTDLCRRCTRGVEANQ